MQQAELINRSATELIQHRFVIEANSLQSLINGANRAKGFNDHDANPLIVPVKLALVVTEIAEGVENHRCGSPPDSHLPQYPGVQVEMADAVIRLFHLAGDMGFSLAQVIVDKVNYNATRPHRHGGKAY